MRSLVVFRRLVVSMAVLASAPARADNPTDFIGPRELAVGEAMRGGATGQTGATLNPSGIPLNRELVFEGGYGYRSTDSASLILVSACDSTSGLPGCFFYEHASASPTFESGATAHHATHLGGMALSYLLLPRVLLGGTIKYFHFDSDLGEPDASGFGADFGATIRLTNNLNIGVSGQNLWTTTESDEFPRTLGGGVYARPLQILALSFDMKWNLDGADQAARYGGGAELYLPLGDGQNAIPLRGGALHDNGLGATYISGGLGYATTTWGLDIGARHQVKGGDDTEVIASIRVFGPRLATSGVQ
ncbi:MAG TPA: hypothetical protein VGC42_02905 [Kofleriaceae bacterium]